VAAPLDLIDDWPVRTVAAGVLAPDGSTTTRGPATEPFALASVTKPLAALAALVAVEEGTLHLDQSVTATGVGDGVTVRHLLAHASGLAFDVRERIALPGSRRIYSNVGFDVLGEVLADASGMPAATYLHEALCEPLGLAATRLEGSPAHAARSTVAELLVVADQLLRPTLLAPETIDAARTEQFPGLDGVLPGFGPQRPNPWGLGFEIRGRKHPHWTGQRNSPSTYGHFGRAGTFLWVDPEWGGALVVLTDRDFGPWTAEHWPVLADAVVDAG
jgi:CubicO group peptidase (beta-lactamase class C family)